MIAQWLGLPDRRMDLLMMASLIVHVSLLVSFFISMTSFGMEA